MRLIAALALIAIADLAALANHPVTVLCERCEEHFETCDGPFQRKLITLAFPGPADMHRECLGRPTTIEPPKTPLNQN